jgi:alkyl sulfatase BDS1-like metallo-beta-lactamase superfamily hydrolase
MSTELFLDFIGIRMDSKLAEDMEFSMNLITPDNGEKFAIELSNATFTNIEGFLNEDPDLTITIDRTDLTNIMMGAKSFAASIADGTAEVEGDVDILARLAETLTTFEIGFEVFPGTAGIAGAVDLNPYEVAAGSSTVRGE